MYYKRARCNYACVHTKPAALSFCVEKYRACARARDFYFVVKIETSTMHTQTHAPHVSAYTREYTRARAHMTRVHGKYFSRGPVGGGTFVSRASSDPTMILAISFAGIQKSLTRKPRRRDLEFGGKTITISSTHVPTGIRVRRRRACVRQHQYACVVRDDMGGCSFE